MAGRLIKVEYAGLLIGTGGNSSITLTDKYRCAYSYDTFTLTFECVVRNATRATFLTAEAALIAAYRTPDADLDVELGGTNRHSFATATNTGFNARPTCSKLGRDDDTANSARYACGVVVQLPADLSGRSGRRTSSVSVDETPSGRKRATISGEYTALSSNAAKAQYESAIAAFVTSTLSTVGLTSTDLVVNSYNYDDQNKILRFTRTYEEIIFSQSLSETDVSSIRSPRLIVRKQARALNDVPGLSVRPLINLFVSYEASIDKAVTTDLVSLYASTIRPTILSAVASIASLGSAAVVREEPAYDRTDNRISVTMDLQADAGGDFFQARLIVEDRVNWGVVLLPVWNDDPYARDAYQGPVEHVKVVRLTTVGRPGAASGRRGIPTYSGFIEIDQLRTTDRFDIGVPGDTLPMEAVIQAFTFVRANINGLAESRDEGSLRLGIT